MLIVPIVGSLGDSEQRFKDIDKEFDSAREQAKEAKDAFNVVKKKRCDLFNKAFRHIEDRIDQVYKDLTKGKASPQGGIAYLSLEEPEVRRFVMQSSFPSVSDRVWTHRNHIFTVSSTTLCLLSSVSEIWSNFREERRLWLLSLYFSLFTRTYLFPRAISMSSLMSVRDLRSFHPSPFFVLDEVDGALGKLCCEL